MGELLKQARNLGSDQAELEELGASAKVLLLYIVHISCFFQTVVGNVTTLLRCVKSAEDTSGRGEAASDAAIEAIGRAIAALYTDIGDEQHQSGGEATPEDLVAATKAVTEAVAGFPLEVFLLI